MAVVVIAAIAFGIYSFMGGGKAPTWAQPVAMLEADGATLESTLNEAFGEGAWEAEENTAILTCGSMPLDNVFTDYGNLVGYFGTFRWFSPGSKIASFYPDGDGDTSAFYDLWNQSNYSWGDDENVKGCSYSYYFDSSLPDSIAQSNLLNKMAQYTNLGEVYYEKEWEHSGDYYGNYGYLRTVHTKLNINGEDYCGAVSVHEAGVGSYSGTLGDITYSYVISVAVVPLANYAQYGASTYDEIAEYIESLY